MRVFTVVLRVFMRQGPMIEKGQVNPSSLLTRQESNLVKAEDSRPSFTPYTTYGQLGDGTERIHEKEDSSGLLRLMKKGKRK